ncbi:MAG TPA: 6-phosphogluconolactonase [Thermoanaerobaculia bacterium]|nr:6-phosphogluconolactonase [Thermoanaerobaculia bacterium]
MEELSARPRQREVRVFPDAAVLTRAAAEEFVRAMRGAAGRWPSVALAGGGTPRALYQLLADCGEPFRGAVPWPQLHVFWGDERHVPPDHPESNYRMAREALLDRVPVEAAHVHRIAAEEPDAERAAERYEAELRSCFALPVGGLPRFDLLLLGMGEEGHTASLFPASPALSEQRRLVAAPWVPAHATFRITLTPPVLNAAAEVVFLVAGEAKAAALAEVLEGERRPWLYPAQIVGPERGRLLWLVDRDAASRLGRLE